MLCQKCIRSPILLFHEYWIIQDEVYIVKILRIEHSQITTVSLHCSTMQSRATQTPLMSKNEKTTSTIVR